MTTVTEQSTESMLTTIDNPHSPFTAFDAWRAEDERLGYYTCGLLDRIAFISPDLPEEEIDFLIEQAIDEIVEENVSGMHIKVTRDSYPLPISEGEVEDGGRGSE